MENTTQMKHQETQQLFASLMSGYTHKIKELQVENMHLQLQNEWFFSMLQSKSLPENMKIDLLEQICKKIEQFYEQHPLSNLYEKINKHGKIEEKKEKFIALIPQVQDKMKEVSQSLQVLQKNSNQLSENLLKELDKIENILTQEITYLNGLLEKTQAHLKKYETPLTEKKHQSAFKDFTQMIQKTVRKMLNHHKYSDREHFNFILKKANKNPHQPSNFNNKTGRLGHHSEVRKHTEV